MKDLPNIAIKYDKENWKTTTKLAVDLLREQGFSVVKRKDDNHVTNNNATVLSNDKCWGCNHWEYEVDSLEEMKGNGFEILTIPQDLNRLKEILGVIPEYVKIKYNEKYDAIADALNAGFNTWDKEFDGVIMKVVGGHPIGGYDKELTVKKPSTIEEGYLFNGDFEVSSKEAFEAQEAKKNNTMSISEALVEYGRRNAHIILEKDNLIKNTDKENKKLKEQIIELKAENLGSKKLLGKRDKEINRLNDVINSANKQAHLVFNENKNLIDENKKLKGLIEKSLSHYDDMVNEYTDIN